MGCNAWNHPSDCDCGFRGAGRLTVLSSVPRYSIKETIFSSFTNPNALCPICGAQVFYYENSFGSKAWFDELGVPWPKHPCFDNAAPNSKNTNEKKSHIPCVVLKNFRRGIYNYITVKIFDEYQKEKIIFLISENFKISGDNCICFFEISSKDKFFLHYFNIENMKTGIADGSFFENRKDFLILAKLKQNTMKVLKRIEIWRKRVSIVNWNWYLQDLYGEKIEVKDKISLFLWLQSHTDWNDFDLGCFSGFGDYEINQIRKKKLKFIPSEKSPFSLGLIEEDEFMFLKNKIECIRRI